MINLFVMNGLAYRYRLGEPTFISEMILNFKHVHTCTMRKPYFRLYKIRAISGQRSSLCALPLNLTKSMTHDLDLKVAQVGRKSIKFQTNIYKHAKYQLDPSTCSRDIDF